MNRDRPALGWRCLAVVAGCVFATQVSIAAGQERSAPGRQKMERLACLDTIANPKKGGPPIEVTSDERSRIITGCLSQMGEFGSAMTRACAERDLSAYQALLAYPEACAPFVVRCARKVGQHGWGMVKICVDKDIGSERTAAD